MDPMLRDLLFLVPGAFLFARNASKGLLGLRPSSLRVRLRAPRAQLPPDRTEAGAWLERHGFARLGRYAETTPLSLHPMIEMDVFVHEGEASWAYLGPPFERLETPYLYFLSGLGDGTVVFTASYPREPEEGPGFDLAGAPGASPMKAWDEHRARVAGLAAAHGPARAASLDRSLALEVHRRWEQRPGSAEKTRAVFALQTRLAALGLMLLLAGALRPLAGLALGHVVLGVAALYVLVRSLPQALCHLRPAFKRISVAEPRPPSTSSAGRLRAEMEALGFRHFGTQLERLPLGTVADTTDALVHEAEGAWANVGSSPLGGAAGYFLSVFGDGALVMTWTEELPVEKTATYCITGAGGVPEALRVHRSVVAEFAQAHGTPRAAADPRAREEAAGLFEKVVSPGRHWMPYRPAFRVSLAALGLLAAAVAVGAYL